MRVNDQVRRLVELGVPALAGMPDGGFAEQAQGLPDRSDAVVVVHPRLVPPSLLTPLLRYRGAAGFVVADMTDLDEFGAVVPIPDDPLYLVRRVDRGDDMRNRSPDEALPEITARGRSPLTISEGVCWLLQQPDRLERNHCFMTIGSRKPGDRRTPAVWISDGAPKVGWCWAGNRHTWLGFASTAERAGRG